MNYNKRGFREELKGRFMGPGYVSLRVVRSVDIFSPSTCNTNFTQTMLFFFPIQLVTMMPQIPVPVSQ